MSFSLRRLSNVKLHPVRKATESLCHSVTTSVASSMSFPSR